MPFPSNMQARASARPRNHPGRTAQCDTHTTCSHKKDSNADQAVDPKSQKKLMVGTASGVVSVTDSDPAVCGRGHPRLVNLMSMPTNVGMGHVSAALWERVIASFTGLVTERLCPGLESPALVKSGTAWAVAMMDAPLADISGSSSFRERLRGNSGYCMPRNVSVIPAVARDPTPLSLSELIGFMWNRSSSLEPLAFVLCALYMQRLGDVVHQHEQYQQELQHRQAAKNHAHARAPSIMSSPRGDVRAAPRAPVTPPRDDIHLPAMCSSPTAQVRWMGSSPDFGSVDKLNASASPAAQSTRGLCGGSVYVPRGDDSFVATQVAASGSCENVRSSTASQANPVPMATPQTQEKSAPLLGHGSPLPPTPPSVPKARPLPSPPRSCHFHPQQVVHVYMALLTLGHKAIGDFNFTPAFFLTLLPDNVRPSVTTKAKQTAPLTVYPSSECDASAVTEGAQVTGAACPPKPLHRRIDLATLVAMEWAVVQSLQYSLSPTKDELDSMMRRFLSHEERQYAMHCLRRH